MTQHELDTIIQSGEGYKTEFKRSVSTDLAKEIVTFANSSGGRIFIGIEDNGRISGITIDNSLRSKVTMMAQDCDPSVEINLEAFNNILIVHVAEGKDKPYRCTNGFYIRNGASTIKLSTQQIIDFIKTEGKVKFDELRNKEAEYPETLNIFCIDRFKQLSDITADIKDEELLTNLGLLYPDESPPVINNTGVLFFIQNPAQYLPQCSVTCVAYKGNTKVDILDKKTFDLDIITNIDDAITFLKRHLNVAYEIKGKRRSEKLEIPEVVLREAVVNAVTHRDYFEKGANVMVEVFDNRVEISNPGGLPKGLKEEDFGSRTLARNPLIAALLNRAGYIEKLGTGIPRIRKCMADAGLPEPDFHFDSFFKVGLRRYNGIIQMKKEMNVTESKAKRIAVILQIMLSSERPEPEKIAVQLETTSRTIRNDMEMLQRLGWLTTKGATNAKEYELTVKGREQAGKYL